MDNYRALFTKLRKLAGAGELREAVDLSRKLGKLLGEAPPALAQANVMADMKVRPLKYELSWSWSNFFNRENFELSQIKSKNS